MNHKYRDPVERLHRERWERANQPASAPDDDPALAEAYRSLQLHWLRTMPGYKALIRQRVAEAAREAEVKSRRFDRYYEDHDYLGREVEGCG